MRARLLVALLCPACIDGLTQVAGTGALYTTRCAADMVAEGVTYRAQCSPPPCGPGFVDGPVSHVVVALDPGRKIVGTAERVCVQDLADASARFGAAAMPPPPAEAPHETTPPSPPSTPTPTGSTTTP